MKRSEILSRDEQCQDMVDLLSPVMHGRAPNNALIYGKTGVGKSLLTKFFTRQLVDEAGKEGIVVRRIYVDCSEHDTTCRILSKIANTIAERQVIPIAGVPKSEYYARFWNVLNNFDGFAVVILDEVDKMKETEILYSIPRAVENENLEMQKITIICNTNDLRFKDKLDSRIKSSLGAREYLFPPYNANQLKDILSNRAEKAFFDGVLGPGVISLCAALAAQEHGDARRAINLLRTSGELAEQEQARTITEEHVRKALYKTEHDQVDEAIRTLPKQSKLILASIVLLKEKKDFLTATEVYGHYTQLCSQIGVYMLTQRRANDLISELDMLGIIDATVFSRGRYGRAMKIDMNVPLTQTKEVLLEDEMLRHLSDVLIYKKGQTRFRI